MRARPTHLSETDRQRLRRSLLIKRDELLLAQEASMTARRGVHDRVIEQVDVAEEQVAQADALRLGVFDAALLADVEVALEKLEDGRYGISESSGEPIPVERLDVVPWARRTAQEQVRADTLVQ